VLKKSRLLLLDANVVLEIFRLDLWRQLTEKCEVYISETVAGEAQFIEGDSGRQYVDLNSLVVAGQVTICRASITEIKAFRERFDRDYFSRLDLGEAESLTILLQEKAEYRICSADGIVFKILGNLRKPDLCVSLEKALSDVGFGRSLDWQYTEEFRERYLQAGSIDRIQGRGVKK
jgi:hypothetical protein